MKVSVLIDNNLCANKSGIDDLTSEWGLSVFIEYNNKIILLDAGDSGEFTCNARKMGIDLKSVNMAVLSHGHYDHSDGFGAFFEENKDAKLYLMEDAFVNSYDLSEKEPEYLGIKEEIKAKYMNRMNFVNKEYSLGEGIYLLPHSTPNLSEIGKGLNMYSVRDGKLVPDDFIHELSLIFETDKGLMVFNSCSHGGIENIIEETRNFFPGKHIYGLFGGLHLYKSTDEEVEMLANKIKKLGIEKVYTGHCTGDKALKILQDNLGEMVEEIYTGMIFEI